MRCPASRAPTLIHLLIGRDLKRSFGKYGLWLYKTFNLAISIILFDRPTRKWISQVLRNSLESRFLPEHKGEKTIELRRDQTFYTWYLSPVFIVFPTSWTDSYKKKYYLSLPLFVCFYSPTNLSVLRVPLNMTASHRLETSYVWQRSFLVFSSYVLDQYSLIYRQFWNHYQISNIIIKNFS
jgi:hypothetical protein